MDMTNMMLVAMLRAVRLHKAHGRRVRAGGQYTEANMGVLVALQRAERVWGIQ